MPKNIYLVELIQGIVGDKDFVIKQNWEMLRYGGVITTTSERLLFAKYVQCRCPREDQLIILSHTILP